jgi:hypothetical protein
VEVTFTCGDCGHEWEGGVLREIPEEEAVVVHTRPCPKCPATKGKAYREAQGVIITGLNQHGAKVEEYTLIDDSGVVRGPRSVNRTEDDDSFARRMQKKRGVKFCDRCYRQLDSGKLCPVCSVRQSGRTLNALVDAVSKAKSGKHVTYVVHQISHANYCINLMRAHGLVSPRKGMTNGEFKFNGGGVLRFLAHTRSTAAPEEQERRATIYDHHVLESPTQPGE